MIGRERELARLRQALDELQAGAPAVVAVVGEPGIGKSRLLRALREDAARRAGCSCCPGRAAEFERDLPYGALVDALDEHLRTLDAPRLRGLRAPAARADLPRARATRRPPTPMLAAERYRAHRAVLELLARLAATRPLVLTLDDMQDADPALAGAARRAAAPDAAGAGAGRDRDAQRPDPGAARRGARRAPSATAPSCGSTSARSTPATRSR